MNVFNKTKHKYERLFLLVTLLRCSNNRTLDSRLRQEKRRCRGKTNVTLPKIPKRSGTYIVVPKIQGQNTDVFNGRQTYEKGAFYRVCFHTHWIHTRRWWSSPCSRKRTFSFTTRRYHHPFWPACRYIFSICIDCLIHLILFIFLASVCCVITLSKWFYGELLMY